MNAFNKIIGYKKEKEDLIRLCDVMKNESKYLKLGVVAPQAILLYGEPGLGKTMMAKAFIAESGRKCFECKKDRADGEFVNALKTTFDNAIKDAPSIVFLDDMDKFAQDNLDENCNKEEFVVIQSCLEDIKGKSVFVVATANNINNLPYSLLRAGRFGRQIEIKSPCFDDSVKIIEHYLKDKKISKDISPVAIACALKGRSCAVLENVINEAGIYAAYEGLSEINKETLINAILRIVMKTVDEPNRTDQAKRTASFHEAGHAVIALKTGQKVGFVTIKKYGNCGGLCSTFGDDEKINDFYDYKGQILRFLAGKAAVEIQFNQLDMGASQDIDSAMEIIRDGLETDAVCGLKYTYHLSSYAAKQDHTLTSKITDKALELLQTYYDECKQLLIENKVLLENLANALYEKEVLIYDDILEITNQ